MSNIKSSTGRGGCQGFLGLDLDHVRPLCYLIAWQMYTNLEPMKEQSDT